MLLRKCPRTIDIVEAAYAVDLEERQWLERLVVAMRPDLDQGLGIGGLVMQTSTEGNVTLRSPVALGLPPQADVSPADLEKLFSPALLNELNRHAVLFGSLSQELPQLSQPHVEPFSSAHAKKGIGDVVGLFANDLEGEMIDIFANAAAPVRVHPNARAVWRRIGAHVATAFRLRRNLTRGEPEAILTSDGHVADARGPGRALAMRRSLAAATRARERARGPMRREDGERALSMWRGLIEGRWSLVDRFDVDGRRYIVAHANAPRLMDPRRLTPRERTVVQYASRGTSNKEIAYILGVSISTVGTLLASSLRKLRLRGRAELASLMQMKGASATVLTIGTDRIGVLEQQDAGLETLLPSLSASERLVATAVLRGRSDEEIARERGTSRRTVSNQISSLYRKLGIHGRAELAALVAGSPSHQPPPSTR